MGDALLQQVSLGVVAPVTPLAAGGRYWLRVSATAAAPDNLKATLSWVRTDAPGMALATLVSIERIRAWA